jgi:hypothetical protein
MSGPGGTKTVRRAAAYLVGLLLTGSLASCDYEDGGDPRPTAAGPSHWPAPAAPIKDPGVLGVEASNYAELHKRLAETPGSVLLSDAGAADGPGVGFTKAATVMTAGPHTVTAACVGVPHAQIYVSQNTQAGTEHIVLEVDCSRTQSQVVQLQRGYVSAQLTRPDPTGAWTGAVAGIKITGQ